MYNLSIQEQRNRGMPVFSDESTIVNGMPTRKCRFKIKGSFSDVNCVQGKRSSYLLAFFRNVDEEGQVRNEIRYIKGIYCQYEGL